MLHDRIAKTVISIAAALLLFAGTAYSQLSPPSNLAAKVEGNSVMLTWKAPTEALVSYNIYRASAPSSAVDTTKLKLKLKFSKVSATTETSFKDKIESVEAGGIFTYYVVAVGSDGKESAGSNNVNVKIGQSETNKEQDQH